MKMFLLFCCLTALTSGCASYRGGSSDSSERMYGTDQSGPAVGGNDFDRGGNRFNQESSEMLRPRQSDVQTFRQ
ncbi:MAG TPA: hypothetical protein VGE41_04545 [Verrucomicrobiae bacterium]|jgi:hypothetical protein